MLPITPLDLDGWASRSSSRSDLPSLVRRLVHARPITLSLVDFPAYESTTEAGWDGHVEAWGTDAWVPDGPSCWELSCEAKNRIASKANSDFRKRTDSTNASVRKASTFVFVTPRKWSGKERWRRARLAEGAWADVRVYDADTLSAWIEQALGAWAWMASQLGRSIDDICTLTDLWAEWAGVAEPRLPPSIFAEAVAENRAALESFIHGGPHSFTVEGETRLEAAAFAAAALQSDEFSAWGDRTVVARTTAGLQYIKSQQNPLVVLAPTHEVELVLGDLATRMQVIVATDRSSSHGANATIEPLTWEAFHSVAIEMAVSQDDEARLEMECGRRIAILRRRLSQVPAIRAPSWAGDPTVARPLVGLALIGGWVWSNAGDREILTALTGLPEGELEGVIRQLAALPDAPIFSVSDVGGVISRPDAFGALRNVVTNTDLRRFFELARLVFGEVDPALELPAEKRWAANVFGKVHKYTGALRHQMAETACFLAVAGKGLFGTGVTFDCASAASALVRDLLAADKATAWFDVRDVLQPLAEAAPDEFLSAIERDLPHEAADQGIWQTIKPADTGLTGTNYRTSVLWALERLAWSSSRFPRVALVLAGLAQRKLDDNWMNKPSATLYACLHPWLAQTAAPVEARIKVLQAIEQAYPEVAWPLAMEIVDQRLGHGHYSVRPRYRSDAVGFGHQANGADRAIMPVAADLLLARPGKTLPQVLKLIDKTWCFHGEYENRLWDAVEAWLENADEATRVTVRERIRQIALRPRQSRKKPKKMPPARALALFKKLESKDPIHAHAWLFADYHVELGADELEDDDLDFTAREKRIAEARSAAVAEIWSAGGLEQLIIFARKCGAPEFVGHFAAKGIEEFPSAEVAALVADSTLTDWKGRDAFISGALRGLDADRRRDVLDAMRTRWREQPEQFIKILQLAPADETIWAFVDALPPEGQHVYWRGLQRWADWDNPAAIERACRGYLSVQRPVAAFRQASFAVKDLSSGLLIDILDAVARIEGPADEVGKIEPYRVEDFFEELDQRDDFDQQRLLQLEFAFTRFLDDTKRGMARFSKAFASDPSIAAKAIEIVYLRDDKTPDPESSELTEEQERRQVSHWREVLENVALPPGADESGRVDPEKIGPWMTDFLRLAKACGREWNGMYAIGALIGRTIKEVDGYWPEAPVARALEPWVSDGMAEGLYLGVVNSRGAVWRGRGGKQERELAEKYRRWIAPLAIDCPKLARALERIAKSYERQAEREDEEEVLKRQAPPR